MGRVDLEPGQMWELDDRWVRNAISVGGGKLALYEPTPNPAPPITVEIVPAEPMLDVEPIRKEKANASNTRRNPKKKSTGLRGRT